jgi:indole-3-glycerol phosphate synthase
MNNQNGEPRSVFRLRKAMGLKCLAVDQLNQINNGMYEIKTMNILERIVENKRREVSERKAKRSEADLERSAFFLRETFSLKNFLLDEKLTGIIAEFKRKSPSRGVINDKVDLLDVTTAYANSGASGLSVLTDETFFGGSQKDLENARVNPIPLLCKDFMLEEYQVLEAKASGADVVLLIAACLTPVAVKRLAVLAKTLKLEILLEIHGGEELSHICDEIDVVGVNNRDLKTFTVDVNRSIELSKMIPPEKIMISESGINSVATIHKLRSYGFKGFLIGENFMKEKDPAIAFASFVNQLKNGIT